MIFAQVAALYDLWHALAGSPGAVTIFDVAALVGAEGLAAPTVPVSCSLGVDGVFRLERAAASHVAATAPELSAADVAAARAALGAVFATLGAAGSRDAPKGYGSTPPKGYEASTS